MTPNFCWRLYQRSNGYFYADGRGNNSVPLGRRSLGVKDFDAAQEVLKQLDHKFAIQHGLIAADAGDAQIRHLPLGEGASKYLDHVARPAVTGGVRPQSGQRYKAVLEKFVAFCETLGIGSWHQVTDQVLNRYSDWLERRAYAYATQYFELTVLKQVSKALRKELGHRALPSLRTRLKKPGGTSTYCYSPQEYQAMVEYCGQDAKLLWLQRVILTLGHTGLRIGELAQLQWPDVDLDNHTLRVVDTSRQGSHQQRQAGRTNKTGRDRSVPLAPPVIEVLRAIPRVSGKPLIFRGPRGGLIKPDTVRRTLIRDVIEPLKHRFPAQGDQLGFADGRIHSLRHFFVSRCANQGVPLAAVKQWLWAGDSKMLDRYYHPDHALNQQWSQKLDFLNESSTAASP